MGFIEAPLSIRIHMEDMRQEGGGKVRMERQDRYPRDCGLGPE